MADVSMERQFEKACEDGVIPGAVLLAKSRTGKLSSVSAKTREILTCPPGEFEYQWSCGYRSVRDKNTPLEATTLLRIASSTKLIVSVCAMQCVESGLVGLDDDVTKFVTELKDVKLLTGFDERGDAIEKKPKKKITLRNLLSHSSGFAYDSLSPPIVKWHQQHGRRAGSRAPTLVERYSYPLDAEPGTRWIYSPSLDWVGRAVEHLTGQKLEDYIQTNIRKPLNLKKMTFFPQQHQGLLVGHADMTQRNEKTGVLEYLYQPYWDTDPEDALGGSSLFTTAEDFFDVLSSLLLDDHRLLSSDSVKELLAPQLTPTAKASLAKILNENKWYEDWNMGGAYAAGAERDHSLCGMYLVEDLPNEISPRRPGSSAWAGLPNLYWLIDPNAGICTFYASQLEPTWDKQSKDLLRLFERTMYARMYEARKSP